MPRFVLLRHECPPGYEKPSHWDLMLERDGVLMTWELRELPAAWVRELGGAVAGVAEATAAVRLADHRVEYLDYEGPLTDGRGSVVRSDRGSYEVLNEDSGLLEFSILGNALAGGAKLTSKETHWHLSVDR